MIQIIRETHETPRFVDATLRLAGGNNRFGGPNYRAVWGWNRLDWIGGKWEDRAPDGSLIREVVQVRHVPKYTPHDRWHIERWMPPESYGSPEDWARQTIERADGISIPALGPFPERGDYEQCFTLAGPQGQFVQLTADVAAYIAYAIERGRYYSSAERAAALNRREDREDRDYDRWAMDVLDNATPAFHGQPAVNVL